MSELIERYQRRALELREQGKTGYECGYCGNPARTTNAYGTFCAGCGAESKHYAATMFGIPVDLQDTIPALMEFGIVTR